MEQLKHRRHVTLQQRIHQFAWIACLATLVVVVGLTAYGFGQKTRERAQAEQRSSDETANLLGQLRDLINGEMEIKIGQLQNELAAKLETLQRSQDPVEGETDFQKQEREALVAQKEAEIADLKSLVAAMQQERDRVNAATNRAITEVSTPVPATQTQVDVDGLENPSSLAPDTKTPSDDAANPAATPGKEGPDMEAMAKVFAAVASIIAPELIPVLAAIIGGDLFGTEYEDLPKVVEAVQNVFKDGAEVEVEAAVEKIVGHSWQDPSTAIAAVRKLVNHDEMRRKLGNQANELQTKLSHVETLFATHQPILAELGYLNTLRLLGDLPKLLLVSEAEKEQGKQELAKLARRPYDGVSIQQERWRQLLASYVQAAVAGKALRVSGDGLKPFLVNETDYVREAKEILAGQATPNERDDSNETQRTDS